MGAERELEAVEAYLPRAVRTVPPGRQELVDGTLLFADVSGFTRLSERLARRGRAGAEEMVGALLSVFGPLVAAVGERGGDVLKFGGDALFVLFRGDGHALRGASSALALRRLLRQVGAVRTGAGTVRLGMSQGLHSGPLWLLHPGTAGYRDVVAVGETVTAVFALETAAESGEVLLGPATAAAVRAVAPRLVGARADGAAVLLPGPLPAPPAPVGDASDGVGEDAVPHALRGRLAEVLTESEHRTVSVGFVQFRGCDAVLSEQGPDELLRRLDALVNVTTDLCWRHRVTLICVDAGPDGGKLMLAAGAPDADDHDAEAALLLCRELAAADTGLALHAGVNCGPAYAGLVGAPARFTYSTMGDTVNVAARLSGKAGAGQVVASDAVLLRAGGRVVADPLPPFALKGKSQVVHASLLRPAGEQAGPLLPEGPPLVGRALELAALETVWSQRALHGTGVLVEVVAGPGVGKTRLLAELVSSTRARRVVTLRAGRADTDRPYATSSALLRRLLDVPVGEAPEVAGRRLLTWLELHAPRLRDVAPLLATAMGAVVPETARTRTLAPEFRVPRLHDAVEELLALAAPDPLLLVLEEGGLLDDASRGVLRAALRRLDARPWLVVLSRRPEQEGLAGDAVAGMQLVLPPLEWDAALSLATAAAPGPVPRDDLARLVGRADGNPLFLLELVVAWTPDGDELPDSVEAILAARVDRLPVPSRRLLRYASVLGERVEPELLVATLAGADPGSPVHAGWLAAQESTAWQVLEGLLQAEPDGALRFQHDLVRRVAYDELPFARRRELHARAATALAARGSQDLGLLARHAALGGDPARAWPWAVAAAEAARAAYAHAEAATLAALAVEAGLALDDVPREEVARVAEQGADSADVAGRYDAAQMALGSARRLAPPAERPRLLGKQGQLAERRGRYPVALGWYTRALSEVGPADPLRLELLTGRAAVRYRQGRYDDVVADCLAAVGLADPVRDRAGLAHAWFLLDAALTDLGREDEAVPWREQALPVFEELGDLVRQADVLNNLGIDAYYADRLDDALALYARSRDVRARAGDVVGAATAENNIAEVLSDMGRLDEAEDAFREALAVWSRSGYPVGVALATSNLGRLRTRQGRPEEGLLLLADALAQFRALHSAALAADTESRVAEALLAAGRPDEALALCQRLLAPKVRAPGVAQVAPVLEELRAQAVAVLGPAGAGGAPAARRSPEGTTQDALPGPSRG